MTQSQNAVRVGGAWLAAASFLMIVTLGLHGPIAPSLEEQMLRIAEGALRWSIVHWIAAAALSLFAVAGLIVLTGNSRLTEGVWVTTAWAVITVGALWTLTTAVAETTVITDAALSGSTEVFESWWAFAEGKATGFSFLALAVAVIAGREARNPAGFTPTWAAWTAAAAGTASFAGWALGMWFGIAAGNLLWVLSSILMNAWTLWFGVALTRSLAPAQRQSAEAAISAAA